MEHFQTESNQIALEDLMVKVEEILNPQEFAKVQILTMMTEALRLGGFVGQW
jgi:hypothetical protein